MATVAEILVALAPELASTDPTRLALIVDLAETRTGQVFGTARPQAVALLAAHLLTVGNGGGASGDVTSESVGPLSITYAAGSSGDGLSGTRYGRMLLELQNAYVFSAMTRTMG